MAMASSHLSSHSYSSTQQSPALGYPTPPMSQDNNWIRGTREQSRPRSMHSVSPSLSHRSIHDHLRPHHSLPSPPQQQDHSFNHIPSDFHNHHHHGRSHSPLSPPASDGLMSPPMNHYQQDAQDKLSMGSNLPGIWMSNDHNMSMPMQGHASTSPPPLFLEDILRAEDPHNMPVMGDGFMDDHEFQDHSSIKRSRSVDVSSVLDMQSSYEDSPALAGALRDRKKRRLTDPSEANFYCNKCGKYFSRIWNYNAHLETHDPDRPRPHVCRVEECKKAFVRRTDLTRHQACVHAKEKKFRCELCNNMFARKDTLRRHEDDGCPKRIDIASRANKNKPITWNSQALNLYSSMPQRDDTYSNMAYDNQMRPNHYDNGITSHLPPLSNIVPIQRPASVLWG